MSQNNPPLPKPRPKTDMLLASLQDVQPEYGIGVEKNMPVDVEVENRKLVQEVNSLKAQVVALQQELVKERAANKEKEQLLLRRELDLDSQKQNLSDERCDLVRERVRLQGVEDELTVMKKDLEHREFDLRNMESGEGEMSAHIATRERKLCEQEEALQRFKVEIDEKTKVLQQWEGSLQQMQHEFAIQRQQHEDAMQRRWEQLQRESAIQQQSGYNVPAYGQPPYWGGSGYAVMHSPGPDMYQPSSQLAGEPNVMPKYPKPPDSNCETLPSRTTATSNLSTGKAATNTSRPAARMNSQMHVWDDEIAIAMRQEEEDLQQAYKQQLKSDEEFARKLQEQLALENAKGPQQGLPVQQSPGTNLQAK